MLRRRPAFFVAEENAFSPAHKEIVFNPTLNHNDGLLTESYMEMYGMDFNEAQQALKQDLTEWRKMLDEHGTVSSGRLGSFRRNEDGALLFEPAPDALRYSVDAYGLETFHMAPVASEHKLHMPFASFSEDHPVELPARIEKKVRKAPLSLRIAGRVAGIAAAAVVLFFLITTPVKEVNRNSYTAGFTPSEILTSSHTAGEKEKASPAEHVAEKNKPAPAVSSDPAPSSAPVARTKAVSTVSTAKEIAIEQVARGSYYVIIGSFDSRSRARKFLTEVDTAECRQIGMVRSGQQIRIYAAKYDNRAEAEAYVSQLRKKEKFKTSWLYIGHRDNR